MYKWKWLYEKYKKVVSSDLRIAFNIKNSDKGMWSPLPYSPSCTKQMQNSQYYRFIHQYLCLKDHIISLFTGWENVFLSSEIALALFQYIEFGD